jgi:hypothetical protein
MANEQRTPLARTLPLFAQRAALREIEQRGYALPCHVTAVDGAIVTVAFDVSTTTGAPIPACTMALAGAEYIRLPIQVGCKGVAYPASCDISIETGLGPGSALPNFATLPANLSALTFFPIGNANWTASPNANATVIYGAGAGVILQDISGSSPNASVTVNSSGVTIKVGSKTWTFTSSGFTWSTGIVAETHGHGPGTYVAGTTPVTGESGEPIAE